jgi:membrane-associated phospholipid phosphatase
MYVALLHITSRWKRAAVFAGWLVFALITGMGRVAAGRHWPLDVLVSYIVGLGLLSGLIWLYTAIRRAQHAAARPGAGPHSR